MNHPLDTEGEIGSTAAPHPSEGCPSAASSQRKKRRRKFTKHRGVSGREEEGQHSGAKKKRMSEGMDMETSSPVSKATKTTTLVCDSHRRRRSTPSSSLTAINRRLVFPDALLEQLQRREHNHSNDDDDVHSDDVFFELANADEIAYRVRNNNRIGADILLIFQQDLSVGEQHTGGIIWETSYFLLEYLLHERQSSNEQQGSWCLGRTLELGAGVGFLGQCLAAEECCTPIIVLTETAEVLINLQANVQRNNRSKFLAAGNENASCQVVTCALDWTVYEQDVKRSAVRDVLQPHTFDTLLGTDVIFAAPLVEPLLQTASFLSHSNTVWYLCVHIRCSVAHTLFLAKAPDYGFDVEDVSAAAFSSKRCAWGKGIDCFLYRITRTTSSATL